MKRLLMLFLLVSTVSMMLLSLVSYSGRQAYAFYQSFEFSAGNDFTKYQNCAERADGQVVEQVNRNCEKEEIRQDSIEGAGEIRSSKGAGKGSGFHQPFNSVKLASTTSSEEEQSSRMLAFVCLLLAISTCGYLLSARRRRHKLRLTDVTSSNDLIRRNARPVRASDELSSPDMSDLPDGEWRRRLVTFERALPLSKRRYAHETYSTWANRIRLDVSLLPYLAERYDNASVMQTDELNGLQAQLDNYLRQEKII